MPSHRYIPALHCLHPHCGCPRCLHDYPPAQNTHPPDIDAAEAEVQKLQSRKETGAIFNYYLASMTQLLRELQLRRDGREKTEQTVEFRMPHSKYWFTHPEGQYWPLRIMRYNEDVSGQMMNNLVRDMYLEIDALTRCLERHGITNWQEEIINY